MSTRAAEPHPPVHAAPPDARHTAGRVALWIAPLIVLAVAAHAVTPFPVGVTFDDAVYVELGKALATGAGLHYLHLPGLPAATHFPPGYPAFLALLWRLVPSFPANILLFKAANAALLAIAAAWVALFARRRFGCSRWAAAAAAIVLCLGVPSLVMSALVMSETLFLALLVPALVVAERAADLDGPIRWVVAAAVLAAVSALVRSAGIALVGALVLVLLLRRRPRSAAGVIAAAAVVLAPWLWWMHVHAGQLPPVIRGTYGPYENWFADAIAKGGPGYLLANVVANGKGTLRVAASWLAPVGSTASGVVAAVLLLPLAALGAGRLWKGAPVTAAFLAGYLAIVAVWPYAPDRFLFGIWPLLGALPLLGAYALVRRDGVPAWAGRRGVRAVVFAAAGVAACGYIRVTVACYRGSWWNSIPEQRVSELRGVIAEVRSTTPADTAVCTEDDAAVYLYTGRQALPFASFEATDHIRPPTAKRLAGELRRIVARYHPDGVIVTSPQERDAAAILAGRRPPVLALTDSFPGGFLYSPTAAP